MKIKVFTKHYIPIKPATSTAPMTVQYDFEQEFIFIFDQNIIQLQNSTWCKTCDSLDDCFKAIKGYFSTCNYHINDIVQMME
jgi:hypothetical protein